MRNIDRMEKRMEDGSSATLFTYYTRFILGPGLRDILERYAKDIERLPRRTIVVSLFNSAENREIAAIRKRG